MGQQVLKQLKYQNIDISQKKRIDHFQDNKKAASFKEASKYIKNKNYPQMFNYVNIDPFKQFHKYNLIIFDSFAELADSRFLLPNKKPFFTVKGDVYMHKLIEDGGKFEGQINLSYAEELIKHTFDLLHEHHECPIIYIHYSSKFEKRNHYIERSNSLLKIIQNINKQSDFVKSIHVPDEKVGKHGDDDFPYHYDLETINEYSILLQQELYGL